MNLPALLQELVKQAIKLCDEWKNEGKLHKHPRLYQKYIVEKFEYKNGNIETSGSFPIIQKEEWSISDVFKLIDHIKNTSSFKNCIGCIEEKYPKNYAEAEFYVSRFLQETILGYLNGKFNPNKDLVEYIVIFIHDLEGNPTEWEIKVWLEGVWMKVDKIEVAKGITIRKPLASDIEYEYIVGMPLFKEPFDYPSAILEIKGKIKSTHLDLEKIIIALQLYKVGSVTRTREFSKPKSFMQIGGISKPMRLWSSTYKYPLDEQDIEKLPKFVDIIKDKLPIAKETGSLITTNPLGIALLRYQDAILKPEVLDNKIAYAVMGLEALYLKAEERDELSHRLAQRVAKLLSLLEEKSIKPIQVYNIVKKAYEIRSNFVHGSFQTDKQQEIKKILDSVLEYLRQSIIIFIQLQEKQEKENLLSLLDNALLETQAENKLKNLIEETLGNMNKDFILGRN